MIIEYIGNTCDVEGIKAEGEMLVVLKDGEPVLHYDLSDFGLGLDVLSEILEKFGFDIKFAEVPAPSKQLIKKINKFLKEQGY